MSKNILLIAIIQLIACIVSASLAYSAGQIHKSQLYVQLEMQKMLMVKNYYSNKDTNALNKLIETTLTANLKTEQAIRSHWATSEKYKNDSAVIARRIQAQELLDVVRKELGAKNDAK